MKKIWTKIWAKRPAKTRLKNTQLNHPDVIPENTLHQDPAKRDRNNEPVLCSKYLQIERKSFVFELKSNASGRFLRITEGVARRRDTIIVPASGLQEFRTALDDIITSNNHS